MTGPGSLVSGSGLTVRSQSPHAKLKEKDEVGLDVCGRA